MRLLQEFIEEILAEKIRSKVFNLNDFKALVGIKSSPTQLLQYCLGANKGLKYMGQGSSRIVFLLSSKKVLKLAYDQETGFSKKGIAQNATEVKVFSDQKTHNIVSKIYDHGPKYEFIISELVNTSNKNAIEKYLGIINALDFFGNIEIVKPINLVKEYCVVKAKENLCLQFATSAQNLIADHRLFGDLTIYNHWGFTSDGRLVALDYGFDEEVQDMYANDRFKIPEDPNFSKNTTYK